MGNPPTFTLTPQQKMRGAVMLKTDTRHRTDAVFYNLIDLATLKRIVADLESGKSAYL